MKRVSYKHIIGVFVIFCTISIVYFFGVYAFLNSYLKKKLSPASNAVTGALLNTVLQEKNTKKLQNILNEFYINNEILAKIEFLDGRRASYRCNLARCSHVLEFAAHKYPVQKDGKIIAYLTITPDAGYLFSFQHRKQQVLVLLFTLLGLIVFITAAVYVYLRRNLFFPFDELNTFLDNIGNNRFIPIKTDVYSNEWKRFAVRLNMLNDNFLNMQETMQMLFTVSKALTTHFEINEIFGIILDITRKKFGNVSCSIFLLGEDGFLKINSQKGMSPDFVKSMHLRPGEGMIGQAFEKAKTIIVDDSKTQAPQITFPYLEKEGIKSFVHVPLMVDDKCAGVLNVNAYETEFFDKERVDAVLTLAEYLSIALKNVDLYSRVQELNRRLETQVSSTTMELIQTNSKLIQKVREMKVLSDIASFAAAKSNLSEILDMIVEKIKELLLAQAAGFFLYSQEMNDLTPHPPFFGIRDREFSRLRFRLEEVKVLEDIIKNGTHYVLNDAAKVQEAFPLLTNLFAINSIILMPLRLGNKAIGVLGVANKFGTFFTQDDARILQIIADRASGVIENVTLYQELQQQLHDMTTLSEISGAISSEPVLGRAIGKIAESTAKAFQADLCAMLLYDEDTKELISQSGVSSSGKEYNIERISTEDANSLDVNVFKFGEALSSPDVSIDPRVKDHSSKFAEIKSLLIVPLRAENRVIGVLEIGKNLPNAYIKTHLRLATLIAHQAAVIIENAHLYDSLKQAKAEQERLNQVKNEFLSIVSHELRTPITAIKGFVKIVLNEEAGDINEQQKKFLQIADQSTDRLTVLISDLLDISKIESGQMSVNFLVIDPHVLLVDVVRSISHEAVKKSIKLELGKFGKLPQIFADKERIVQVLYNLIQNAIKFTSAGGKIVLGAQDKGDFIQFSVEDTGIGIPLKEQQKIFDKFYQINSGLTRSITGTGLGLSIAKSIVEAHGGQIWVESEESKGSKFCFIVPRAKTEIKKYNN